MPLTAFLDLKLSVLDTGVTSALEKWEEGLIKPWHSRSNHLFTQLATSSSINFVNRSTFNGHLLLLYLLLCKHEQLIVLLQTWIDDSHSNCKRITNTSFGHLFSCRNIFDGSNIWFNHSVFPKHHVFPLYWLTTLPYSIVTVYTCTIKYSA